MQGKVYFCDEESKSYQRQPKREILVIVIVAEMILKE